MTEDRAIVVERRVAAQPERVYAYLTDSKAWAKWQGVEASIEAHPGGLFRMRMGNGMVARGQFVTLDENRRIVFTWGWIDNPATPPGSSTVEIELIPDGDGHTLIKLTHTGLEPGELPPHAMGWDHYLSRLATVAAGGDPGADPGPA